jgi:hypothetical protein
MPEDGADTGTVALATKLTVKDVSNETVRLKLLVVFITQRIAPISIRRCTGKVTPWLFSLRLLDRADSATSEFLSYRLPIQIADSRSKVQSAAFYRKTTREGVWLT